MLVDVEIDVDELVELLVLVVEVDVVIDVDELVEELVDVEEDIATPNHAFPFHLTKEFAPVLKYISPATG